MSPDPAQTVPNEFLAQTVAVYNQFDTMNDTMSPREPFNPKNPSGPQNRYGEGVGQFSLRIPDYLHDRAKEASAAESKSLNTWICEAVEQRLGGMLRSTDPNKRLDRIEQDMREIKQALRDMEKKR